MSQMERVTQRVGEQRGRKREDTIREKPLKLSSAMGILVCLRGKAPLTQHQ